MKALYSLITFAILSASPLFGKTVKVAAVIPEGTSWANNLKKMAKEIKKATNGDVKIKLYLNGAQGDEPVVLRKIRSGQLHGGIFTGKALGDIYGDVRLLEVPFNFINDRAKAQKTLTAMSSHLNKGLESKGFQNLGFFELGQVYIVSKNKATKLDSLKGSTIWAWEGDELVSAIMNNLKLKSVPLGLTDVLTSLSTGMIKSAYATPLAIVAMQWQSKVNYLFDFPVTYSFGGLLLSNKIWKKIDKKHHKTVLEIAQKWTNTINDTTIKENQSSLAALKGMKIQFIEFPKSDVEKGYQVRKEVLCELKGKLFSPEGFNLFLKSTQSKITCKAS